MLTSNVLDNKCFRKMKHVKLWKNVILWAISRREISSLLVIFSKKIDQPSWRTTRRNYKHIPQIVCISSRFRVLHLLSREFDCYTCMSFKTCWSRLIYMKLSSHRSFVINMYVITMAWRCISPWSFYRSLQKRRETDIFRICQQISAHSEVKTTEKKRGKTRLNARKHWESESINRNLSVVVWMQRSWLKNDR